MATFTYTPDFGARAQEKPRVLSSQFGDGYQQRVGDGINTNKRQWALTFAARTDSERDAILSFLRARNGVEAFDWTPPTGAAGRWVCQEWDTQLDRAGVNTVTATFVEDFAP